MMIWVGEQVANERWPGTNVNVYEASFASVGTEYAYYPAAYIAGGKVFTVLQYILTDAMTSLHKLEADWHNPFSGPEVKGVTPQGLP